MKKLIVFVLTLAFVVGTISAQSTKAAEKERKAMMKASKSELNKKATKTARKEAKKLSKEGWTISPGALPIEKQLDKSYSMQYQYDAVTGYPKFFMAEAMSIGENYDAAKMQALELAKQNLVGQIQTEITALIENTVANKQLSSDEAASITESVIASKSIISQNLGRTLNVVELYRTKTNGNKEVLVRVAYDGDAAKEVTKNAVRENLEQKGEDLHDQLDKALGFK